MCGLARTLRMKRLVRHLKLWSMGAQLLLWYLVSTCSTFLVFEFLSLFIIPPPHKAIITFAAYKYIKWEMNKVKPQVIYERRKARYVFSRPNPSSEDLISWNINRQADNFKLMSQEPWLSYNIYITVIPAIWSSLFVRSTRDHSKIVHLILYYSTYQSALNIHLRYHVFHLDCTRDELYCKYRRDLLNTRVVIRRWIIRRCALCGAHLIIWMDGCHLWIVGLQNFFSLGFRRGVTRPSVRLGSIGSASKYVA